MPWGELQWSEAEMLDELAFLRWCEDHATIPQCVNFLLFAVMAENRPKAARHVP